MVNSGNMGTNWAEPVICSCVLHTSPNPVSDRWQFSFDTVCKCLCVQTGEEWKENCEPSEELQCFSFVRWKHVSKRHRNPSFSALMITMDSERGIIWCRCQVFSSCGRPMNLMNEIVLHNQLWYSGLHNLQRLTLHTHSFYVLGVTLCECLNKIKLFN